MKKGLLLLLASLAFRNVEAQVAYQGFETASTGTAWSFTATPGAYYYGSTLNDIWKDTTYLGNTSGTNVAITAAAEGSRFWGAWDLENPYTQTILTAPYLHTLDFAPVTLNPLTSYTFKFKYFTHVVGGTGDSVGYQIEYNTGTSWSMSNYVNLPLANKVWDSVAVSVPAATSAIRVRFRYRVNGGDDYIGLDGVQVVAGATSNPPSVVFGSAYQMADEAADTLKVPVVISNRLATGTTSARVARVSGFGTASTADLTAVDTVLTWSTGSPDTLYARYRIVNDVLPEAAEYLAFALDTVLNGNRGNLNKHTAYIVDNDYQAPQSQNRLQITHRGSYKVSGAGSSAEITAWDSVSNRLYVVNSLNNKLHLLSFTNPGALTAIDSVDMSVYGGGINSVAAYKGLIAVAVEATPKTANGKIVFLDTAGRFLKEVPAGPIPDMICFSPNGRYVLTANEGEPESDYSVDPEGSITIVDLQNGVQNATAVNTGFSAYNGQEAVLRSQGVRIFGVNATAAKDFEPEYITVNKTSDTAYVTLQENNALAVIHIPTQTVIAVRALGTVDHSLSGNALDVSDQNNRAVIANWPVRGMYMPDAIASYNVNGQTYLITANEGDARDYSALKEEARVADGSYKLDSTIFRNQDLLKAAHNLGRLTVTNKLGDTDGDGDFDVIYAFGGRSFSIWNAANGTLAYNSGDRLEQITLADPALRRLFNVSNSNIAFKDRSDAKGPEPEGVCIGSINDTAYAFVALERTGGFMAFNVTDPTAPVFEAYRNTRDTLTATGDLGAEGILFISHKQSRDRKSYVITSNEVSGTVAVFEVTPRGGYLGTTQPLVSGNTWNVYPNPVQKGTLYFSQPATGVVLDLNGRRVATFRDASHVSMASLVPGTYLIQAEGLKTQKIVVE
ncbi:MAG: T9SS type A sorting domain-containing protein [Sphingobacteriales bacterium]|nr:MAG: T9SS type A sorting domain-containing protein [Sphingobacteriales bacterium]